jgi:protein-S-isoprenylcysteine O-methyltransferase Ste14
VVSNLTARGQAPIAKKDYLTTQTDGPSASAERCRKSTTQMLRTWYTIHCSIYPITATVGLAFLVINDHTIVAVRRADQLLTGRMSSIIFAIAKVAAATAFIGGIIFTSAGRWDLPFVWAILGIMCAFFYLMTVMSDPELVKERASPGPGNVDRLTRPVGGLLLIGHWILVGLDVGRFHWSLVPWSVQVAGIVGYAAALTLNLWAMRVNRFYSSVVRVQSDRGHCVIDVGPYRFVRHPGYLATLAAMLSGGIALGSWLAMIPVLGFAAIFIRRTMLEDQMLRNELPNYAEYARRVRWRLIPGVF